MVLLALGTGRFFIADRYRSWYRKTIVLSIRKPLMKTVTISPKFQVVIPELIRQAMKLKAGEKVHVFQYEHRIEYIPERKLREMRGFLRGINTDVDREDDRL